jgi:hypothetical protein
MHLSESLTVEIVYLPISVKQVCFYNGMNSVLCEVGTEFFVSVPSRVKNAGAVK